MYVCTVYLPNQIVLPISYLISKFAVDDVSCTYIFTTDLAYYHNKI